MKINTCGAKVIVFENDYLSDLLGELARWIEDNQQEDVWDVLIANEPDDYGVYTARIFMRNGNWENNALPIP